MCRSAPSMSFLERLRMWLHGANSDHTLLLDVVPARVGTGRCPDLGCVPRSQILYLTDLEHWSPHAVYQATRLFVSNLNAKMVRRHGISSCPSCNLCNVR